MIRRFARHLLAVAACGAAAVGCGSCSPLAPDSTPNGSGAAVVTALRIEGNLQLAGPNESSQLRALAVMPDGAVRDVTPLAVWQVDGVAVVSETGMVRAFSFGVAVLTVRYGAAKATVGLRVMPTGTHIVAGFVREPGNLPVADAIVEVIDGPSAGRSAQTDLFGRFNLTPVGGDLVTVRVTRDGYATATRQLTLSDDLPDLDLELPPAMSPINLSGEYQLTIEAAPACALPQEVRQRQYTATIAQDGAKLTVRLSGATFRPCYRGGPPADRFGGRVLYGSKVSFQLGQDDYDCTHDVLEQITDTSFMQFIGTVTGAATERTISAELFGYFALLEEPRDGRAPGTIAACTQALHSLRFRR